MKLKDIVVEAGRFQVAHFPSEDNPNLAGAGERTVYAQLPVNKKGGGGFRVRKAVPVVSGKYVKHLRVGDHVFITNPSTLFKAADLEQKGTSYYVGVGLRGPEKQNMIGYIPISAMEKPSRLEGRVVTGKKAQDQVFKYIKKTYGAEHAVQQVEGAKIGSQRGDLVILVDNVMQQIEIKNTSSVTSPITFFDKTVRRGMEAGVLDDIVRAATGNPKLSLEKYIDRYRKVSKKIGYPGDKGVQAKSGSFPRLVIFQNEKRAMKLVQKILRQHLAAGGDTHFAIYYGDENPALFYVGEGPNKLGAPLLPEPFKVVLDTYGGAYKGGMRVGLKVQF